MRRIFFLLAILWCGVSYCGEYHYINYSVADMYTDDEFEGKLFSQVIYGTPVEIIDDSCYGYYIKTPDGECGWTWWDIIETDKKYPSTPIVARINTPWTYLYSEPDFTSCSQEYSLPFEVTVEVVSPEEDLGNQWIQIRDIEGDLYWIRSSDVIFNPELLSLEEMLEKSTEFLNIPYLWGGASAFGFDCSSFMQMLFRLRGIALPRFAQKQADMEKGTIIPFGEFLPGDLLFFNQEEVCHVGLYLGDDTFIHDTIGDRTSSRPAMIQLSSITDDEWKDIFLFARRL
ncbi:MAG: C40 family peptidase [Waddliaceae bacterium]|jgi:gamma-D-glutamyl-L-lysine dipeptidyl-peptidase|nr:C40 family peptidase [Waddliaceae bacterium]MBT3579284.1 C40 family peptidase [Waddliaceae bacterium]MBT6928447.1 C40 family peptidase [Waddliaceae bacterium]MBT7264093.1 C40 family peptidase [Waddliaceae bacterium]MBT7462211.1 C40 family peptidase [Waddliaceae bacterium]